MESFRQSTPEQQMLSFNTGIQLRTPSVLQLHVTMRLDALKKEMDKRSALKNLGIVFDDGKNVYLIQRSGIIANPLTPQPTHLLITKATEGTGPTQMVESAGRALNTGELASEWSSTLLSCGGAIIGTILIFGGGAALPLSGGASYGVIALAGAGTLASWGQCARGGVRLANYHIEGNASYIDQKDAEGDYVAMGVLLDTISLASAGGAVVAAAKTYRTLRAVSSNSALNWLKGMSRAERRRLSDELSRLKGLSGREKKEMIRAGLIPKTVDAINVQKVVQQEMLNAAAAAMAYTGSAVAGVIRSPRQVPAAGKYALSLISGY